MCQPIPYFAIAARLLKTPVSTSRRISLQISMSLCTPVPLSERGCDRGYRPDRPLLENCTVVRRHFGPPRHGPRAAVFDRRQHLYTLAVVPEPSTWVMGALGIACAAWGALRRGRL